MQVAWSPGCFEGPDALPPPARAALERAARRAAAAFAGEAAASGGSYGRAAQVREAAGVLARHLSMAGWLTTRLHMPTPAAGPLDKQLPPPRLPLPQEQGWHIEVVPSSHFYCGTAHRCIVLTTAAVAACWAEGASQGSGGGGKSLGTAPAAATRQQQQRQQEQAEAALLFLLGHEMGHGLGRHTVRAAAEPVGRRGTQARGRV